MELRNNNLIKDFKGKIFDTGKDSSDFDLNLNFKDKFKGEFTPAAVLILISEIDKTLCVTLTKRSSNLKNHPSQISFPGGKRDEADKSLKETALREAQEEIGLPPNLVEVIGHLSDHKTVTGFQVKPYVGLVSASFELKMNLEEVEEVFTVPLNHFIDLNNFTIESKEWKNQTRFYYTVPYGPHYIWGATARIARSLAEILVK
ncbi:MAG: CoA pyrophosphatase [Paracoccaceae bacterium]